MSDDSQFYEEELERTKKAKQDLSDHKEKERTTVAGFLRVLKIPYEDCKIQKEELKLIIDIRLGDACFQVTEILDEDRRRGDELGKREDNLRGAVDAGKFEYFQKAVEVPGPFLPPVPYTSKCYFQRILSCSERKSKRYEKTYGREAVGNIDFLVYINLKDGILSEPESWPDLAPLKNHGWRSVSFVDNGCARVLYAREDAPVFLREATGKTHIWPLEIEDKMFPQRLGQECEHPSL